MSKINKGEALNIERIIADMAAGKVESGNIYYHQSPKHDSHIDLHANMADGTKRDYRLYKPADAEPYPMLPETFKTFESLRDTSFRGFSPLPPTHNHF